MGSSQRSIKLKSLTAAILLPLIVGSLFYGVYSATTADSGQFGSDSTAMSRFLVGSVLGIFFIGIEAAIFSTTIYMFVALRDAGRLSAKFYKFAAPAFLLSFFIVTAIGIGLAYNYKYVDSTDPGMSASEYGKLIGLSAYCGTTIGSLVLAILMLCSRLKAPSVPEETANGLDELDSKGQ